MTHTPILFIAGLAATLLAATACQTAPVHAPSLKAEPHMRHATGTFDVKITPEAQGEAPEGGAPTGRMALHKTFHGPLSGAATGVMISGGVPAPGNAAAYVAIDQFTGTLDGAAGGFMLVHRGTMAKSGASDLSVIIAPDSGTGALDGITGTLAIRVEDGKHYYDLDYALPGD